MKTPEEIKQGLECCTTEQECLCYMCPYCASCDIDGCALSRDALEYIRQLEANLPKINGDTSDGYHTFNELYHHRALLFSVIVKAFPDKAWKARQHHDGTMYDGMFIVGIDTPEGQANYHYDIDPYWGLFDCQELERAPEWDGHTPAQAIERIGKLEPVRHGRWGTYHITGYDGLHPTYTVPCSVCAYEARFTYRYCPNCGARMDGGKNE